MVNSNEENPLLKKLREYKKSKDTGVKPVVKDYEVDVFASPLKKKEATEPDSSNGSKVSGMPSSNFQNINSSNDLIPSVDTIVPTPLTKKAGDAYLEEQLQPDDNIFDANLGSDRSSNPLAPANPELINSQGIGGKQILDSKPEEQVGNYGSYTWNQLLTGIGSMVSGTVDGGLNSLPGAINFTPSGVMAQIGEKVFGLENPYKKDDKTIQDFRQNDANDIRNFLKDNIGAEIDDKTEFGYQDGIISGGIGGLVNSLPAMAGTALTGNITPFFIQGYDFALQSLDGKDVDDETKTIYATSLGYVNARLEKFGFDKIFHGVTNGIASGVFKKSIKEAAENTSGKVTGNVLDKYIDENLKGLAKNFAKFGSKSLQGFAAEYGTGSAQEISNIGAEYILNASTGKSVFDTKDMSKWEGFVDNVSRVNKAGLMEGVGGFVMGGAGSIISPSRKKNVLDTQKQLSVIEDQLNNPDLAPEIKEVLLQRKLKLQESIVNDIAEDNKQKEELSPKQKENAERLSTKIDELDAQLQNEGVPAEVKEMLQLEFNEVVQELENIEELTDTDVGLLKEESSSPDPVVSISETTDIQPNDIVNYTDEEGNVHEVPVESVNGEIVTVGINNEGIYETKEVPLQSLSKESGVENNVVEEEVFPAEEQEVSKNDNEVSSDPLSEFENDTPEQLASKYSDEVANPTHLSEKERAIANMPFSIKRDSYIQFGDNNNINSSKARSYFSKKGLTADVIAQEINNKNFGGSEIISPQDIIDFMDRFPNGNESVKMPSYNPNLQKINDAYFDKTGKKLNKKTAKDISDRTGVTNESVSNIVENEEVKRNTEILFDKDENGDYNWDEIGKKLAEDEEFFTIFPGGFTQEEILALKNIVQDEKSKQQTRDNGRGRGSEAGDSGQILQSEDNSSGQNIEGSNEAGGRGSEANRGDGLSIGETQAEHNKSPEIPRSAQEFSDDIRRSFEAATKEQQGSLTKHQLEDIEKQVVLNYAKENNLWIDDFYSLGDPFFGGGNENTLSYNEQTGTIFKSNNLLNSRNSVIDLLRSVEIHNKLFPETKYEVVGFTGIDNGKNRTPHIEVVLKQNYILNAIQATQADIDSFMESLGFEKSNDHTFTNKEYTVSDLRPRNVLKDNDGGIYVIDDIIKDAEIIKIENENIKEQTKFNNQTGTEHAIQDRKASLTTDRIRPLKVKPTAAPKKLSIILKEVSEALHATLIYSKSGRSRSLGTYNPSNTLVKIRNAGDLDTTAHELGHLIDDRYDLLGKTPLNTNIKKELKWFFERGGSNPPSYLSAQAKKDYLNREGFAEFIRAYIVNKPQTKFQSPDLYNYFEQTIDEKTKQAIENFSSDFLNHVNASYGEQIMSNIESSSLPNKNEFLEWFKTKKGEYGWNVTFLDKVNGKLLNSLGIAEKAFKFGLEQTKISSVAHSKNFEILARVFAGVNGKTLNMLNDGLRNHKNILLKDAKGNPLNIEWLLDGLDNTSDKKLKEEMDDVIKLLVAERTIEYAKKFNRTDKLTGIGAGVDTDIEVAIGYLSEFDNLKSENIDKYNRVRESADKYREFADAGLKYARDKGRISIKQYNQIKEDNKYYVSLARRNEVAPDEDPLGFSGNSSSSLTGIKDVFRKAKGGTNTIKNPYLSLIENTVNIITESDRNEVIQSFVKPFAEKRQMGNGTPVDLAQVARQVNESGKNTKSVYIDGKKELWQFEEEVYKSLSNFDKEPPDGFLSKLLQVPGKVLRITVTKFPVFFARNITRDTQQRLIVSRTGSGLKDFLYNKTDKELFEIFGGSQGGYHLLNRNAYSNALGASIKELSKSKKNILLDPKRIMNGYDSFLEAGENLNRIAEFKSAYRKAKEEGLDDYEAGLYAAYQARDLMDFAVAGTYLRSLNKYVPFTNAAVQGLRRAYKSAKENPKRFSVNIFTNIIIPQLIIRAIVHAMDDDDEYEELPAYQRDMFWNFKTPFTGEYWISIPKPFEIGMFGSITDRTISALMGYEDAFEDFGKSLISTLSPVDETTMLGPLRPYIEILANRDFFRDQIIVPVWEQDKLLALRDGTKYASNIGKKLSTGMGLLGMTSDPRYIDHFIKSTTSYYGDLALRLGDLGTEESRFKFNISNSGFAKEAPVYNSRSVKEAFDLSKDLGLERSRAVKNIRNMIESYYSLESEPEKEKLLKEIYAEAKSLKNEYQKQVDDIKNKRD